MSRSSSTIHVKEKKVIEVKPIKKIVQTDDRANSEEQEQIIVQSKLDQMKIELKQLEHHREKMVQDISIEIEQEKQRWEQEKEQLIERVKEEGYHVGFELGKQDSLNKYEQLIDKANALVQAATKDYYATIEESNETIISLAIQASQKILTHSLSEHPESFLPIVTAAITELKDQSRLSIYLHPNNYEFVLQQKEDLMKSLDGDTKISIYIDRKLSENDCLIVHPFGQIDAGVDTQLQQIEKALHEISMELK
ncbi:flagellar assembly protein FliH [Virgibacillus sp. W0181]|uniref:flagellar assembly protein FliH n=1 Tax=Virgibacillus sp. W0181 TaxID=3391581 RepID=UPI003F472541